MINPALNINPSLRRGIDACDLLSSAVLKLTTLQGTTWTDAIAGNDAELVDSDCLEFNGADNYIDLGAKVQGQTAIELEALININSLADYNVIFACGIGASATTDKGFLVRANITTGEIIIFVCGGIDYALISTGVILSVDTDYIAKVDWTGFKEDKINLTINGSATTHTTARDWVGDSQYNLTIGKKNNDTQYFDGCISYAKYTINGAGEELLPFSIGDSNKSYGVNSDTEFAINGTVTAGSWLTQNKYHYNILNGFNIVGDAKIPASQLTPGKDVLGNDLSNPSFSNFHNGAEASFKLPVDAGLIAADVNEFFYASGVPNTITFANLKSNGGNIYVNVVEADKQKGQVVMFDHVLSLQERIKLDTCYLKSNELPGGSEWVTNPQTGEYITGPATGMYIHKPL